MNPAVREYNLFRPFGELNHFEQNTEQAAIVVAVPEEATVQFVPEGE